MLLSPAIHPLVTILSLHYKVSLPITETSILFISNSQTNLTHSKCKINMLLLKDHHCKGVSIFRVNYDFQIICNNSN